MVQSISYLHIKPMETYRGNGKGSTMLIPFDTYLDNEQAAAGAEDVSSSEGQSTETTLESSDSSVNTNIQADSDKVVIYKDPVTGNTFTYEDVAAKAKETETSNNATSVDAMKKTKYDAYFKKAAKRYGVSESLLKAIAKAESNFNPNDVSSAGAIGIMQLMPETAKSLGVTNAYDPEQNIMGGAKCIKQKLKEFNGDVRLALAAYNAGSGAVKRNGGVPSYCKNYVNKVLSYKEAYETAVAVG